MLRELESIKGLLQEDDEIPILQESVNHKMPQIDHEEIDFDAIPTLEQQDFFEAGYSSSFAARSMSSHEILGKAAGENPFLPEHIRSRLHGNNPPPSFEFATAKKIAASSQPKTLLGNYSVPPTNFSNR